MKQDTNLNHKKYPKDSIEFTRSTLKKSHQTTDRVLNSTQSVMEKSKELRTPTTKADKIGTAIGGIASIGCVGVGIVQIFVGRPSWAVGTLSFATIALISNRIHYYQLKKKNKF